jgi:hypothetical protein
MFKATSVLSDVKIRRADAPMQKVFQNPVLESVKVFGAHHREKLLRRSCLL